MKVMSNSKHNTLKRLAELYSKGKAIYDNYDYERSIEEEVKSFFEECLGTLLGSINMEIDFKLIGIKINYDISKLYEINQALELQIYKLAWGKESFNGLVDSLIKSDYDESE